MDYSNDPPDLGISYRLKTLAELTLVALANHHAHAKTLI